MSENASTPTPQKEIQSTASNFKLIQYVPESFGGIHKIEGKSVVVFFDQDKPIVGFEGDQGTTKSSNLNCLKALLGGEEVENAINQQDGTKKASMTFQIGDSTYVSKITKNEFTLTEIKALPGGAASNAKIAKPKTVLQNLIGPLGTDPMYLKSMDGEQQIAWLQKMFILSPENVGAQAEITKKIAETYALRTNVNRDVKTYKAYLDNSKYYEFDKKEKVYVTTSGYGMAHVKFNKDIEQIESQLKTNVENAKNKIDKKADIERAVSSRNAVLVTEKNKIESAQQSIKDLEQQIISMQGVIKVSQATIAHTEEEIAKCEEEIKKYTDVDTAYAAANQALIDHGDYKLNKKQFLDDLENFKAFEKKNAESIQLSTQLESFEKIKMNFAKSITPNVEGLEVCVRTSVDAVHESDLYKLDHPEASQVEVANYMDKIISNANREGIYYQGRSIAQLSESELFDLWIRLCKELKINVVFIENISSLGTSAINAINSFADAGGLIFYSAMERGKSELKISFYRNIQ